MFGYGHRFVDKRLATVEKTVTGDEFIQACIEYGMSEEEAKRQLKHSKILGSDMQIGDTLYRIKE